MDTKEFEAPSTGYDMWQDYAISYGLIKARIICNAYLAMQERSKADDAVEMQFCRELRDAMTAERNFTDVPVYSHSSEVAESMGELDLYKASADTNRRCAGDIDEAIRAVKYGDGTHDFDRALAALIEQYSMGRVRFVLADEVKNRWIENRASAEINQWARESVEDFHGGFNISAKPDVLEGLITELQEMEANKTMDENTKTYTLDEIIEMNAPQHEKNKAAIRSCIDGLGVYAALAAQDNSFTNKVEELRKVIDYMAPYWGLDDGEGATPIEDFLQAFDNKVDGAKHGEAVTENTYEVCADILNGLHLHGRDMVVSQGDDEMGEILHMGNLINEVAQYFDYETDTTQSMAAELVDEVRAMLAEYNFPGKAIEGDNVNNYVVQRAVLFDNDRGIAFAHNPEAVSPYVTWQFTNEDGKLSYEWGNYYGSEEAALVNYIERAADYAERYRVIEKALPVAAVAVSEAAAAETQGNSETAKPEPTAEAPAADPALEQPELKPLIQFIDSDYRELFKIPDGESIRITYPPDDGREPVERSCKYRGEMHVDIEKNGTFHICEFAEKMERIGATYEPVNQLPSIVLVPYAGADEKFYKYNREEGNTCAGSLHGNFGEGYEGDRYYANWRDEENDLYTPEMQSEFQSVVYALRQDLLKDRSSMLAYLKNHPEALASEGKSSDGEHFAYYGFKLETESRQYFVNCFDHDRYSRFAIFAYADKPAPVLEQVAAPLVINKTEQNAPGDKPSVLDEIREARSTPKAPAKPKPEKNRVGQEKSAKSKKNQTEL